MVFTTLPGHNYCTGGMTRPPNGCLLCWHEHPLPEGWPPHQDTLLRHTHVNVHPHTQSWIRTTHPGKLSHTQPSLGTHTSSLRRPQTHSRRHWSHQGDTLQILVWLTHISPTPHQAPTPNIWPNMCTYPNSHQPHQVCSRGDKADPEKEHFAASPSKTAQETLE
jgi:hypothetical protein